jgi:DNA-directed RNA polymerase specialized sigma24 family protein
MSTISEAEVEIPNEDEIKLGLLGSEGERNAAITLLYNQFHEKLVAYLERKLPGLPSDLVVNAVVDTFRALNDEVAADTFEYDQPLKSFLFVVAWNKGVDELRKISRRPLGNSEFFDHSGELLKNTEVGRAWQQFVQTGKAAELAQAFGDFLLILPPFQRQVAQVMHDQLPDQAPEEEICEEVFRRTKRRPTVVQVKSAKREIRKKFKNYLSN